MTQRQDVLFTGCILLLLTVSGIKPVSAELRALDDDGMSAVTGQSGITIEITQTDSVTSAPAVSIDQLTWSAADQVAGSSLSLDGITVDKINGSDPDLNTVVEIDVTEETGLNIGIRQNHRRLTVDEVRLASSYEDNQSYSGKGFGGWQFDYALDADLALSATGPGLRLKGGLQFKDGTVIYRDTGDGALHLEGVAMELNARGSDAGLDFVVLEDGSGDFIRIAMNDLYSTFSVEGIRHTTTSGGLSDSVGALSGAFGLAGILDIRPGGANPGTGMTLVPDLRINCADECLSAVDTSHTYSLYYFDGDSSDTSNPYLGLADFYGRLASPGITLDLVKNRVSGGRGDYLQLGFTGMDVTFGADNLYIGSDATSLGEIYGQTQFGPSLLKLYAGGADGASGVTMDVDWTLTDGNIRYADDGNYVWLTGLTAAVQGTAAVDVVSAANGYLADGIRIGLEDFQGGYQFKGLYVSDQSALPDESVLSQERQGGVELLYALGLYQALSFSELDGALYLSGGGASGQGLTINADFVINGATGGLLIDYDRTGCGQGCGIWSSDATLVSHVRNMTFDVEDQPADVNMQLLDDSGRLWSLARKAVVIRSLNYGYKAIGNVHIGHAAVLGGSTSLGGLRIDSNIRSTLALASGGDPTRGNQGVTVFLKNEYLAADGNGQNAIRWTADSGDENTADDDRYLEFVGLETDPDNVSGDGYGLQTTLNIDVQNNSSDQLGFAVNAMSQAQHLRLDGINVGQNPIMREANLYNMRVQANMIATPVP
ncbi:DUF6160 family protein [Kistimonas asteriae]|uniref:DUF6160 family protein n=1 Tax=Kistimonas asteriae TaxID=517724 RepID=UPI001BA8E4D1|nr:DUF6160 family protein [Kistimonas asteriae]